jgi:hypothetical protein
MIGDLLICIFKMAAQRKFGSRMGIARKVLLGLTKRAGCILSLLLNAFEWRFKILNWVGTLSFHGNILLKN